MSFINTIKIFFILSVVCPIISQAKTILQDDFQGSLCRAWDFKVKAPEKNWTEEKSVVISADYLALRLSSGRKLISSFELIDTQSGKPVWQCSDFGKVTYHTGELKPGKYLMRCSGIAGKENFAMMVYTCVKGKRMVDWNLTNTQPEFSASKGVMLSPLTPGKAFSIHGRAYYFSPDKHYEFELQLESMEMQTVNIRFSQHYKTNGKKRSRCTGNFQFKAEPGKIRSFKALFPSVASSGVISLNFQKQCRLLSLTVREAAPPAKAHHVGKSTIIFEPRANEADPKNPSVVTPVAFQRPLRMCYLNSVPQNFELLNKLSTFSTPGEYAVWSFGVHNPGKPRDLELLKITALSDGSNTIPVSALKISHIEYRDYPSGSYTYYTIPELLFDQKGVQLKADENQIFWIQTRLPKNTVPGVYTGKASLKCGETLISFPVRLRVLPFELLTPPNTEMVWACYSRLHVPPQSRYPIELKERYLQDMKDYGITALHHICGLSEKNAQELQDLRRKVGMDGPVIISHLVPQKIAARQLKINPNDKQLFKNPEALRIAVEALRKFNGWMKKHGKGKYAEWYFAGPDEPHLGHIELAAWENHAARQAGVKTASCVYPPRYVKMLAPELDISLNMFIANNKAMNRELNAISTSHPDLSYWFLGGGSYVGQEGGLMPNRLMAGMMSFKIGVKGHLSYTYQNYGEYADFNQPLIKKGYGMTFPALKPSLEKVSVFSLEWEGIREGITDYKYLYTLRETIRKAQEKGFKQEADQARQILDKIVSLIPYSQEYTVANGITDKREFTNDTADKLRAMAAEAILKLHKVIQ